MAGKQRIVLLVLLFFGLPAIVTLALLRSGSHADVSDGAQMGGTVRGVVQLESGKPAPAVEVTAFGLEGNVRGREFAKTNCAGDGAFELALPPTKGRYLLHFKSPELVEQDVEFGWIDASGKTVAREPLAIRMQPGSRLEFEIVHADKSRADAGTFELSGASSGGFFSAWNGTEFVRRGSFENGTFSVDGLPAMNVHVLVRLANGARVDSVLKLALGANKHRVEL